jgi:FkbM family methyltransferase
LKKQILRFWRKIATKPSFEKINTLLFNCATHGLGILNCENTQQSGELNFIKKILPLYIKKNNPIIFDIGAHKGSYSKLVKSIFTEAKIYSCEPNPEAFKVLKQELGSDAFLINKALGSCESKLKLFDRNDEDGSQHASLYKEVITDIHRVEAVGVEVDITTLDILIDQEKITETIELLKIDTEGYEYEVLLGAQLALSKSMINIIHIEFNEMNIISKVFMHDFKKTLSDYIPFRLLPSGVIKLGDTPLQNELFAFQNVVFVHKRFKPNKAMEPTVL